jgi:GAF domain-containing protein
MPSPPQPPSSSGPFRSRELGKLDAFVAAQPVDEATVWLESENGDSLRAVYNPVNLELVGHEQPLSRGLISQVFATGLPLLESDVSARPSHDSSVDKLTGHPTRSLLAVPLESAGEVVGVLSAVTLADGPHRSAPDSAVLAELAAVSRHLGASLSFGSDTHSD